MVMGVDCEVGAFGGGNAVNTGASYVNWLNAVETWLEIVKAMGNPVDDVL
jgi:hypothetical protein